MADNQYGTVPLRNDLGGAKPPRASKTLITNIVLGLLAFIPGASEWYAAHPDVVAAGFAVVNVLLRFITKDKLTLS